MVAYRQKGSQDLTKTNKMSKTLLGENKGTKRKES